ncbi:Protein SGT1 homolog [Linum grandiflorum]
MASDLEKKAKEAFIDDHFQLAVDLYSQAIDLSPSNPDLFVDRAQANIKLGYYTEAVSDANKAIHLDSSIARAYLRKGVACMKLEEYQTAKAALDIGVSLASDDQKFRFTSLIKECEDRIAEELGQIPKQEVESPSNSAPMQEEPVNVVPDQAQNVIPPKPKYKHDFYQKPEEVVVTVFAKGVPADRVSVDFGEQILSIRINFPEEDAYHLQHRLFGKIVPANCKYSVLSTKVEIRLAKAEPIHWTSLEYKDTAVVRRVDTSSEVPKRPAYPSSKVAKVDWDKLEAQVKKEEKEEKLDGDAGLNKFFREIYKDADEDTRRAMQKSFVESNGTVLSTNWKDIGNKKVEGSAPDGSKGRKAVDRPCLSQFVCEGWISSSDSWIEQLIGRFPLSFLRSLSVEKYPNNPMLGRREIADGKACNAHGLYCVPYDTLGVDAVKYILHHSEISIAFAEEKKIDEVTPEQRQEIEEFGLSVHSWEEFSKLDVNLLVEDIVEFKTISFLCGSSCVRLHIRRLGGNVRLVLSGAAPLASHVESYLRLVTCAHVLQGYGSFVYYKRDDLTGDVLIDGWFHTVERLRAIEKLFILNL